MGRKKIEIRTIENDRQKTVTFARRRAGLIKKAHEISVLCGVKVAVVIFDQREACHVYSSTDNPDELLARYLTKQYATNESKKRKDLSMDKDGILPGRVSLDPHRRQVAVVHRYHTPTIGSRSEDINVKSTKSYYDPALSATLHGFPQAHMTAVAPRVAPGTASPFVSISPFHDRSANVDPGNSKRCGSGDLQESEVTSSGSVVTQPERAPPAKKLCLHAQHSGGNGSLFRTNSLPPTLNRVYFNSSIPNSHFTGGPVHTMLPSPLGMNPSLSCSTALTSTGHTDDMMKRQGSASFHAVYPSPATDDGHFVLSRTVSAGTPPHPYGLEQDRIMYPDPSPTEHQLLSTVPLETDGKSNNETSGLISEIDTTPALAQVNESSSGSVQQLLKPNSTASTLTSTPDKPQTYPENNLFSASTLAACLPAGTAGDLSMLGLSNQALLQFANSHFRNTVSHTSDGSHNGGDTHWPFTSMDDLAIEPF
ncbi:hypothetical protein IWQ61_001666 [Dispira simplex]|nr:hypothetical protein IWQ61_001666 [Dispira simplex]